MNESSVPVGYKTYLEMRPLDFKEFLRAVNIKESAIEYVRKKISSYKTIDSAYLKVFESRFIEHILIDGMPEAVRNS